MTKLVLIEFFIIFIIELYSTNVPMFEDRAAKNDGCLCDEFLFYHIFIECRRLYIS